MQCNGLRSKRVRAGEPQNVPSNLKFPFWSTSKVVFPNSSTVSSRSKPVIKVNCFMQSTRDVLGRNLEQAILKGKKVNLEMGKFSGLVFSI